MESSTNKVVMTFPLELVGIIVGIILCILQGVGTIDIGWFWAIFPFWIVLAVDLALCLIVLFIAGIVILVDRLRE